MTDPITPDAFEHFHVLIESLDAAIDEAQASPGAPIGHPAIGEVFQAFSMLSGDVYAPKLVEMLRHEVQLHHQAGLIGLLSLGAEAIDALDAVLVDPQTPLDVLERVAQSMYFMTSMWCLERIVEVCGYAQVMEWFGLWLNINKMAPLTEDAGTRVLLTLGEPAAQLILTMLAEISEVTPQTDLGAISALVVQIQTPQGWDVAQAVMERGRGDNTRFAVVERGLWVLSYSPHTHVANALVSWLDSPHHLTASAVLSEQLEHAIEQVQPLVVAWADDDARRDRRASAVRVLTHIVSDQSNDALNALTKDPDMLIRHMSWYALARRGESLDMLTHLATSAEDIDRTEARESLSQFPHPTALQALHTLLSATSDAYERMELEELIEVWDAAFGGKES